MLFRSPEHTTSHTLQSEQIIHDWYDMVPFGGHDLNRDVHQSSQRIISFYSAIISDSSVLEQFRKGFAQILAITNRSADHHLSLWIVSSQTPKEQIYYRLLQLIYTIQKDNTIDYDRDEYNQYYDAITEVIGTKILKFNSQNWIRSLMDGVLVAASSGVLGWL